MNVANDLKNLAQMVENVIYAPNIAIATMMKREAELFSRRLDLYATDSDKTKLYKALEFAVKASNPRAEQAPLQLSAKSNWMEFEQNVRTRAGIASSADLENL